MAPGLIPTTSRNAKATQTLPEAVGNAGAPLPWKCCKNHLASDKELEGWIFGGLFMIFAFLQQRLFYI